MNTASQYTRPFDGYEEIPPDVTDICRTEEEPLIDPDTEAEEYEDSDPVHLYLKDIGQIPLLNPDAERALATVIYNTKPSAARLKRTADELGTDVDTIRAMLEIPEAFDRNETFLRVMDMEDELRTLIDELDDAEAARKDLTDANLRLVVSIAKKFINRGLMFLDVIQEGNIGLMRSIDRFDPTKGYKFSTYATWWIRQAITRAIATQSRDIRLPVHIDEKAQRINRARQQFQQTYQREPSDQELTEEYCRMFRCSARTEELQHIIAVTSVPLSFDIRVGEHDDMTMLELTPDADPNHDPMASIASLALKTAIDQAMSTLSERERTVLTLRFDLDGRGSRTLEEVGEMLDPPITRERVRQIEAAALRKLRKPSNSKPLRGFM